MAALSLQELLPLILSGGRAGPAFRAPAPVVPAEVPKPRPRPSISQAGPLAPGTMDPEVPIPRPRPDMGTVIPQEAPATRPTLKSRAGDYFRDVAGGVGAASQIDNPLGAFLAGIGGSVEAEKIRHAAADKLALEADERTYQRGRDEAADKRAEAEFGLRREESALSRKKTEAEIAKEERAANNPLTPQVLLDIEERAAAYAKEQGLYDTSSIMSAEERAAALDRVRQYREALRSEIAKTGKLPQETAPGAVVKEQGQVPDQTGAPPVGTVEDGYRFLGGDPALPESWERVQ